MRLIPIPDSLPALARPASIRGFQNAFAFLIILLIILSEPLRVIMNTIVKIFVFHLLLSAFLCDFVSSLSVSTPGRRAVGPVEKQSVGSQDSRLFYTNGDEDHDLRKIEPSAIAETLHPPKSLQSPKSMDLPRHSPPREVVEKELFLLDFEMIFGRVAMVAFLLFLGGEVATGLSIADQINGIFS
jgi:hypothetical protein